MSIVNQQYTALDVLRKLKPIYPWGVVAGGAPRDWYLGKSAQDIDIIIEIGQHSHQTMKESIECLLGQDVQQMGDEQYNGLIGQGLQAVYQFYVADQEVQILVVKESPSSFIRGWGASTSQVATNEYGLRDLLAGERPSMIYPYSFYCNAKSDLDNRKMVLTVPPTTKYAKKMIERFPDWEIEFKIPDSPIVNADWLSRLQRVSDAMYQHTVPSTPQQRHHTPTYYVPTEARRQVRGLSQELETQEEANQRETQAERNTRSQGTEAGTTDGYVSHMRTHHQTF